MAKQLTIRDVEALKADGRYYHAGALQAAIGSDAVYGAHYGMRSTLHSAKAEFERGYLEARAAIGLATIDYPRIRAGAFCPLCLKPHVKAPMALTCWPCFPLIRDGASPVLTSIMDTVERLGPETLANPY